MSTSGFTGGCATYRLAASAILTAKVSDAFQIAVDLEPRDDHSQIDRHRLMQRQQFEAAVVDLHVQRVDFLVAVDDVSNRALDRV